MGYGFRSGLAALLTGALALWFGAGGAMGSTWLGARPLDPEPTSPSEPDVVANASGLAIAGWASRGRTADDLEGAIRVVERRDGAWGQVITLLPPVESRLSRDVRLAIGPSGFAIATWDQDGTLGFAVRSAAGVWGPAAPLPPGSRPKPVVLADGTGLIVFVSADSKTLFATRISAAGSASVPFPVFTAPTPTALVEGGAVTVAQGSGDVLAGATWRDGSALHVFVREIFPDNSLSPYVCGNTTGEFDPNLAITGSGPQFVGGLTMVADGAGGIVTGFGVATDIGGNSAKTQITVANCRAADSGWSQRVVPQTRLFQGPALGLHQGRIVAAWTDAAGIAAMTRDLRSGVSAWTQPVSAIPFAAVDAPSGADAEVNVGVDAEGRFVLPATIIKPGALVFTSAHGTGATPWTLDSTDLQPAEPFTSPYRPAVASLQPGAFVSVWRNQLGDKYVRTADLDVVPPTITLAGIPAQAVAGDPITGSATGQDGFSGFDAGSLGWDFGDGVQRTGPSASTTFLTAGRRTITVTGRDRAGNTATATAVTDVSLPVVPLRDLTLNAVWRQSRLKGSLRVRLTRPFDAALRVNVEPAGRRPGFVAGSVPAGRTAQVIALPRTLAPGSYTVTIDGTRRGAAVTPVRRVLRLPAPVEGVGTAGVSLTRSPNAPVIVQVFGQRRQLWAHLKLSVLPKGPVAGTWIAPGGQRLPAIIKGARKVMEFGLSAKGALSPGTWRIVFTARGRVITTARIRLR